MNPNRNNNGLDLKQATEHCRWIAERQGEGFFLLRMLKNMPSGEKRIIRTMFFANKSMPFGSEIRQYLNANARSDLHIFYSVNAFSTDSAKAKNAVPGRLLHVDADKVELPPPGPQPTRIVESSPGNYHFLYELSDAVEPTEAARLNKAQQQQVKGDKGGHSAAKLLRLPGTRNAKY